MQNTQNTKYNTQNAKYKIQVMETGGACLQDVSACDEVHFKWHCPVWEEGQQSRFRKGKESQEKNTLSFEIAPIGGGDIFFPEVKKNEEGKGGDCFEK